MSFLGGLKLVPRGSTGDQPSELLGEEGEAERSRGDPHEIRALILGSEDLPATYPKAESRRNLEMR